MGPGVCLRRFFSSGAGKAARRRALESEARRATARHICRFRTRFELCTGAFTVPFVFLGLTSVRRGARDRFRRGVSARSIHSSALGATFWCPEKRAERTSTVAEGERAFVPRARAASGASREPGTPAAPRRRASGRARSPVSRRRVHRRGPARIPRWQSTFSRGNFHARRVPPKRAPVRLAPHVSLPRITRDRTHRSRTRSHGPVVRHTSNQITTLTAAVHSRSLHRRRAELSHTRSRIKTKQC